MAFSYLGRGRNAVSIRHSMFTRADPTDVHSGASAIQPDAQGAPSQAAVSPELAQILDAHPQLLEAWDAAR